jgi:hypothetical protein
MAKDSKSKKAATGAGKKSPASKRTKKTSAQTKAAKRSDSSSELEAVKTKKGEPANHLRQRAEWFQKRHGGS